jgi:asparagine synthase (glutamine-hydrolysing)
MCGVAGVLGVGHVADEQLRAMAHAMCHRGPDDEGIWNDADAGVGFAHARLSIIDLSPAGHQPMRSAAERYVFAFNGEIYNHLDLRAELQRAGHAPAWRGHSDSETLLAGFEAWGIAPTIRKAVGMFAIAVWDRRDRALTLVRDRLGEKPLYYGSQRGVFLFGSDLRALKAHRAFHAGIDRNALTLFLRYSYIPAPYSIYEGIHKLTPGTMLTLSVGDPNPKQESYWELEDAIVAGEASPFEGSPGESVDELEKQLSAAVIGQMTASDVPVGAFLSGGVDSSTIVALMQAHAERPVRTFTIGFHESAFDEAVFAKKVAGHLGTDHTELYVTPQQALDIVPRLPEVYSEPFADSSQIPTFLVSRLARSAVTVSLSGDGGDELFGGYEHYATGEDLWRKFSRVPAPVGRIARRAIGNVSPRALNALLSPVRSFLPRALAGGHMGHRIARAAEFLDAPSREDFFRTLVSGWSTPHAVVIGGVEPPTVLSRGLRNGAARGFTHTMMALDLLSYLPDDILAKVDRAAMGVSLETRVPLLDHRVVEFSWRLPLATKVRDGKTKWPLRQILYKHVPASLVERPKMGFSVPVDSWLRGPLRGWAEDLLSEARIQRDGYFNAAPIREKWSEHLSGARNWQAHLWDILMFQAWLAAQG